MNAMVYVDTAALALVCLGCVLHLNQMTRATSALERFGFALTAGGAFGAALVPWHANGSGEAVTLLMHAGLAAIAAGWLAGYARAWLAAHVPRCGRLDRRQREQA